jgi:hypothetical protein
MSEKSFHPLFIFFGFNTPQSRLPIRQKDGGCIKRKIHGYNSWKPENEASVCLQQFIPECFNRESGKTD